MLRVLVSVAITAMRAGPVWVVLAGLTQASKVMPPEVLEGLVILDAATAEEMVVAVLMRNAPGSRVVLAGLAMVRLRGVPTPEVSVTVLPEVSLNS